MGRSAFSRVDGAAPAVEAKSTRRLLLYVDICFFFDTEKGRGRRADERVSSAAGRCVAPRLRSGAGVACTRRAPRVAVCSAGRLGFLGAFPS